MIAAVSGSSVGRSTGYDWNAVGEGEGEGLGDSTVGDSEGVTVVSTGEGVGVGDSTASGVHPTTNATTATKAKTSRMRISDHRTCRLI